jgi:hypothetical protein
MASLRSRLPLGLLLLSSAAAQSVQSTDHGGSVFVRKDDRARVRGFQDPAQFGRGNSLVGFLGIPEGTPIDETFGVYGTRLRLGRGTSALAWLDRAPRSFPPPSAGALTNASQAGCGVDEDGCALVITYEVPVNRVGFLLRRTDGDELNLIVRPYFQGHELGGRFFDASGQFEFYGVTCSQPFDELRLEFTNPSEVLFSLDNLVSEIDLRDADHDGTPDFDDLCPYDPNDGRYDADGDGIGDYCDTFPLDADNDADGDGLMGPDDNCPLSFNPDQLDTDLDGVGDTCDTTPFGGDKDEDGIADAVDNCPTTYNPEQADCDMDGLGDVCDQELVSPASVSYELEAGDCVTLTKTVCLPPAPPRVDVLIAFDTTGSMGGEIANLRTGVVGFINGVRSALPLSDIRFGLVSFRDYPGSFASCSYASRYASVGDQPFRIDAPIGSSPQEVLQAVLNLEAGGGVDKYEAYTRTLWEVSRPDSGIGFRSDAARFLVLVGDAGPHDCDLGLYLSGCVPHFSTGMDPGRDGIVGSADDLDFQNDALNGLIQTKTRLLMLYTGREAFCSWQKWAQMTGGTAVQGTPRGTLPEGTNFVQRLINMIRDPRVEGVTYRAENPCGLQVSFDPTEIIGPIDVTFGAQVTFQETICVPSQVPAGGIDCTVHILADDVLLGIQRIHVGVGCRMHVLDFETEDDGTTALLNAQAVVSPPSFGNLVSITGAGHNLGPAIFDSTPGGPNDPSINSDMLVGHGNMLLLQDSRRPHQTVAGIFDEVTDDPDGGDMVFDFPVAVEPRSVLLADINPPPNRGASVTLTDVNGKSRVYAVQPGWTGTYGDAGPWMLDLTTLAPQPGNGTPRFATATQDAGYLANRVARIVVHMTGYGAMDELWFCR